MVISKMAKCNVKLWWQKRQFIIHLSQRCGRHNKAAHAFTTKWCRFTRISSMLVKLMMSTQCNVTHNHPGDYADSSIIRSYYGINENLCMCDYNKDTTMYNIIYDHQGYNIDTP